jgi:hypothetical protein
MQGAVPEEVWPPGVTEEGCDQATAQEEMKIHWFLLYLAGEQEPSETNSPIYHRQN